MTVVAGNAPDWGEIASSNVTPLRRFTERVINQVEDASPLASPPANPNAALEDIRLPEDLLADLFRHTSELGLVVGSAEVEDPYNGEIKRTVTVARCGGKEVYLAHIPGFVLDTPVSDNITAVDYLGKVFPRGTTISGSCELMARRLGRRRCGGGLRAREPQRS